MIPTDSHLEQGRAAYAELSWTTAYTSLTQADEAEPLDVDDLWRLATAAYMLGRDDEYIRHVKRVHHLHVDRDRPFAAARCAFWIGLNLATRGHAGRAAGWFRRAERLLDLEPAECAERGYLLVPAFLQEMAAGDFEQARATAATAVEISQRFDDRDLFALAVHEEGHALLELGHVEQGLTLLDEAMVVVTEGDLSPIVTGLVYCSVIGYCQEFGVFQRSREWTQALSSWCAQQPDLLAFTGVCYVHRAEILALRGAWSEALAEARRAGQRFEFAHDRASAGHARYREGEVHRLRGEYEAAERAYRDAINLGWEPQPGFALLQLATGDQQAALAAVRRCVAESEPGRSRAWLLAAHVEIALAADELDEAAQACEELETIGATYETTVLGTLARHVRGAVDLAQDQATASLASLRAAVREWLELEAEYEAARARVLTGQACRRLGDESTATLYFEKARQTFSALGAVPDMARLDEFEGRPAASESVLSPREVEVLRLVAAGETNRSIAQVLVVSERTVERHVSNIFTKIGVSSRAAATAYAYEHALVAGPDRSA